MADCNCEQSKALERQLREFCEVGVRMEQELAASEREVARLQGELALTAASLRTMQFAQKLVLFGGK